MFIDENTSRADLIKAVDENLNDVIDAFIDADVDPHKPETPTEDIRRVLIAWIEDGDECANC